MGQGLRYLAGTRRGGIAAAAVFIREHYAETAATVRHLYGLSVHSFGTEACRWGEAWALLTVALRDPDTWLAVKVHGLRYRSREESALTNSLLLGFYSDSETSAESLHEKFLPWTKAEAPGRAKPEPVTAAEYEEATRAMLEEFGVPREVYEAELSGIVAAKRQDEKTEKELEELRRALENG